MKMSIFLIPIIGIFTIIILNLASENESLKSTISMLEKRHELELKKLDELQTQKSILNKELQEVKSNFKEQENEGLNDNLLNAVSFINSRLCAKNQN